MKTKLSFRLHLAVWCVAVALTLVPLFSAKPLAQFAGNLIATLFWLAVYHLFYGYISSILMRKKLILFLFLVLHFLGFTLLFFSRALFNGDFTNFYQGYGPGMHFSGFKALTQAALFGSFFRMITEYFRE
jgi:hypothetical protein